MIVSIAHTVTPCEIAVCRSTINAGSDRWPVRLQTRVRWSSALRLNRDSSLKNDTSQSVTLQGLREVGKNPVDTAYDVATLLTGAEKWHVIARSSRSHLCSWDVLTLRDGYSTFCDPLLPTRATTISLRPRWRPIRLFEQPASPGAYYAAPIKSSAARTAAGYVLEHPKSQYRLSKSSDSFG
ncbi:hypothetical protein TNCV_922331 [Trichonephila clavipes]|nr:hypothetical protein TNCV_922331 [Trichonephila clavipes]